MLKRKKNNTHQSLNMPRMKNTHNEIGIGLYRLSYLFNCFLMHFTGICLFVCLFVCSFVCSFVCLFVCLFVD